jgi:ADP-ribosylglycohydrolase
LGWHSVMRWASRTNTAAGRFPAEPDFTLHGGGLGDYAPGEWSDDTQMAICIARVALRADLRTEAGLDAVAVETKGS